MRVLMTGGGTGGHVNPALAIADTIKKNIPDSEIAFVGTERGLENTLVPRAGYELFRVNVIGLRRRLTLENFKAGWLALVSPFRAAKIIKEFRPDIVIGTGGYASWPVLAAAGIMGIPTAVHESNAVPGLAVRMLAPFVDRIFINFEVTAGRLNKRARAKSMHVGCPISSEIGTIDRRTARKMLGIGDDTDKYIVSFGGSLGARTMNEEAIGLMKEYVAKNARVRYTHASGNDAYESVYNTFIDEGLDNCENISLVKYIYNMPVQIAAADLVICRSGAITCSELSRAGRASVLIPSPNVTDNQQVKNASVLDGLGGAIMIEEADLYPGRLAETVKTILETPGLTDEMEKRVVKASPGNAEQLIFDEAVRLTENKKK